MLRWFPTLQVATACVSCSPPDLNFLDPYFIFMYMHYNHCHRATAHLQLNVLLYDDDDDDGDDDIITGRGGRMVSSHNLDGPGFKAGYRLSWQVFFWFSAVLPDKTGVEAQVRKDYFVTPFPTCYSLLTYLLTCLFHRAEPFLRS